jgi:hypothetical protein
MRAPLLRLLCFVPHVVLAGCDAGHPMTPTPSTAVELVTVAPANVRLLPGGQVALSATPRNADRNPLDRPVTWTSSDPAVATVSPAGLVSAVAAGSVLITAESDGVVGQVVLAVDQGGVVGPEGGEVRGFDGQVLLTVPAGAVSEPASIFLTRSPSAPLDATAAGEPVHVRGTQALAVPATLSIAYDPEAAPAGVHQSALGLRRLSGSGWAAVPGAVLDPALHTASATIGGEGTFGVGRLTPAVPCTAPEHRQFDFWLGVWDVAPSDAAPDARQASSRITQEPGGCAVFEDFHDLDVHGVSISLYDPVTAAWYQTFVDNLGTRLVLTGGLVGGAMLLTRPDNGTRITWETSGGVVRQFGEDSRDGGTSWSTTFDLLYRSQ